MKKKIQKTWFCDKDGMLREWKGKQKKNTDIINKP